MVHGYLCYVFRLESDRWVPYILDLSQCENEGHTTPIADNSEELKALFSQTG